MSVRLTLYLYGAVALTKLRGCQSIEMQKPMQNTITPDISEFQANRVLVDTNVTNLEPRQSYTRVDKNDAYLNSL